MAEQNCQRVELHDVRSPVYLRSSPSKPRSGATFVALEANVFAIVTVPNAFLPLLRKATAGRVVNVTSWRRLLSWPC
jgi:hypothetical protein